MRRDAPHVAHEAAAIRADGEEFVKGVCLWLGIRRRWGSVVGLFGPLDLEQVSHMCELFAALALGEETVVTNAMEAVGEDVEEKTSDELVRGEAHDAAAAAAAIILVDERHFIVVDGDKPRIGDRRAMGVAGEIGEHAHGSAERRLGVDDERALSQRAHAVVEGLRPGERGQFAEEAQLSFPGRGFEAVEEQAAERLRQRMTESRKFGLASTQRLPSRAMPPPGTRQWTWG